MDLLKLLLKTPIFLLLLTLGLTNATAQTTNCNANFTINTQVTPSTCLANGSVVVTLSGDQSNLETNSIHYSISGTTKRGNSYTQQNTTTNNIQNIPAGTYTITVSAQCKNNHSTSISKSVNVTIDGNYTTPVISHNTEYSRFSFSQIPTGKIAVNVSNPNDTYTFSITKGPNHTSKTNYSATKVAEGVYQLNHSTFAPGTYTVQAQNQCGDVASLDIIVSNMNRVSAYAFEELVKLKLPPFNNEYSPNIVYGSTSFVRFYYNIEQDEIIKHIKDNLIDFGFSFDGTEPTKYYQVTHETTANSTKFDLSPKTIEDLFPIPIGTPSHNSNKKVWIRIKNANNQTYIPYKDNYYNWNYIPENPIAQITSPNKFNFKYNLIITNLDSNNPFNISFPIKMQLVDKSTNTVVHKEDEFYVANTETNRTKEASRSFIELDIDKDYELTLTGASGLTITRPIRVNKNLSIATQHYDAKDCQKSIRKIELYDWIKNYFNQRYLSSNDVKKKVALPSTYFFPLTLQLSANDNSEATISHTFNSLEEIKNFNKTNLKNESQATTDLFTPPLTYGKNYTLTITMNGTTFSTTINLPSPVVDLNNVNTIDIKSNPINIEHNLNYIILYHTPFNFPLGTTIRIQGNGIDLTTLPTTTSNTYNFSIFYPPENSKKTLIPPGTYTITATQFNCFTQSVTKYLSGGYTWNIQKGTEELTCSGLKVTPNITKKFEDYYLYATVTDKKTNKVVKSYQHYNSIKDGIYLHPVGEYTIKYYIDNDNNHSPENLLASFDHNYPQPSLSIDETSNIIFNCDNEVAHIFCQAHGGVSPYKYELYDANNSTKLSNTTTLTDQTTDKYAHFAIPNPTGSYTIRFTDKCGNSSSQRFSLAQNGNLNHVAKTEKPSYCPGETIKLYSAVQSAEVTYSWTGPNNFTSTSANPTIPNASQQHAGTYTLVVKIADCSTISTSSVEVRIKDDPVFNTNVNPTSACLHSKIILSSPVSHMGTEPLTYQWQQRAFDTEPWQNISNATTKRIEVLIDNPKRGYQFKCLTFGPCGEILKNNDQKSNEFIISILQCTAPVNPHLMTVPLLLEKALQVTPLVEPATP